MFPIPWNKAYRKKDGSIVNIDDAMSGGGGGYTLPTASSETKGGVKIGTGLTMTGEVLSADAQMPAYTSTEAGKVLTVGDDGTLEWDVKGEGGGDDVILDYFEFFEGGTGAHTYENSITISESGKYMFLIGGFLSGTTVKINNVTQPNTFYDSSAFVFYYHESQKELSSGDVVDISLTSSGRTMFVANIVKLGSE